MRRGTIMKTLSEGIMVKGILVCGLNGAGKSTLGRALAESFGYRFIDVEDMYFPKTDPNYLYASPRTEDEFRALLKTEVTAYDKFVLASVKCSYDKVVTDRFDLAVLIDVPKQIRMARVRARSYEKFGERMLPGGDLYEIEESFFRKIDSRGEDLIENEIKCLSCPLIRVDGTKPIDENVKFIIGEINKRDIGL